MTAITAAKKSVNRQDGIVLSFPMGVEKIPEGALVATNAAGYAVNATDTTANIVMGVADETVDNSSTASPAGANGLRRIKVRRTGVFTFVFGGTATIANVNDLVYAVDNQTVDLIGVTANDMVVGRIVEFISATKVRVDIRDRA